MIHAHDTKNHLGISLIGDNTDFHHLYEAIHNLVRNEDDSLMGNDDIRTRILGLAYDLRHAMQGDRDTE